MAAASRPLDLVRSQLSLRRYVAAKSVSPQVNMSGIFQTGSEGERAVAAWLTARGRDVRPSDNKTFDLIVDGCYAEVKASRNEYAKLGFIGLSDAQYAALSNGVDFRLFVVCNLKDTTNLEVIEFRASDLLPEKPKVECTYYWYRTQLEKCRNNAGK